MQPTYFQIEKTTKNIDEIKQIVEDRMIITDTGKLFYDFSPTKRIELTNNSQIYFTPNIILEELNTSVELLYSDIVDRNNKPITSIMLDTLIFDMHGNIGHITQNDIYQQRVLVNTMLVVSKLDAGLFIDRM